MDRQETQQSLLQRAQTGDDLAWQRLVELYRPLIAGWARRCTSVHQDAEDLAQEILLQVFRYLPQFEHNGRRGAFRSWLRTIAAHMTQRFASARQSEPRGTGDTDFQLRLQQLQDPTNELAEAWDHEHDRFVLNRLLEEVAVEFEPNSMQAFRRQALDGVSAETVAGELNMLVGAVYTAKSRVLKRLRQLSEGLLDWSEDP